MAILEYTLTYAELKQAYIDATKGNLNLSYQSNNRRIEDWVVAWKRTTSFFGPSSAQVIDWLHHGYHQPGLKLEPPIEPVRKRRRLAYGEEGELQIDLAYSGHDYPFLSWTPRDILPGMKVKIFTAFQAGTEISVINAFYQWVLRALIALETAGIDLELMICGELTGVFVGDNINGLLYNIQVKKSGEQNDYMSWSPMFSPAGYRHLGFLGEVIAADSLKKRVNIGLGHGVHRPWSIEFNPENTELHIYSPWYPRSFPEEEMEVQLRDVLLQARRAA